MYKRQNVDQYAFTLPYTSNAYIELIGCTSIENTSNVYTSEKIFKPFMAFMIPVFVGPWKLCETLKQLGFHLFDDIIDLVLQNVLFINDPRTTLMDIPTEDAIKEFTGGSHLLVRSLVHMDNPDHQLYRSLTQKWFAPPNLESLKKDIRNIAKEYVNKMVDYGSECDFAKDIAIFYPLRVITVSYTHLTLPTSDLV